MGGETPRRRVVLVVADHFGQVLDERAAVGDVEQLHAAADRQHRQAAPLGGADQGKLAFVAARAGWLGAGMRLGAISRRVDVGAPRQHEAVESGDEGVEIGVALVLDREDDGLAPASASALT